MTQQRSRRKDLYRYRADCLAGADVALGRRRNDRGHTGGRLENNALYGTAVAGGTANHDKVLYESAKIDGAGPARTFFKITLPLLKPSLLVALLFRTLDAFRVYDLIAVLTGGAQGTETLSIYAYKLMIAQNNYGYGSVVVLTMALCVGAIAFLFVKVLGAEIVKDD